MVFEIAEGVGNGYLWWWMALPAALILLAIAVTADDFSDGDSVVGAWVLAIVSAIAVFGIVSATIHTQESKQEDAFKVEQLERLGFENVDYASGDFSASLDGAYFSGALVDLGDNTFQVIEKVAK